ncbi:hypothetical protein BIU98_05730 [Curtobacterium sp. MMLR14_010]|nr:hypothetical protein BIU98_05730 [Curtobacterium sp. MMLR14_010]
MDWRGRAVPPLGWFVALLAVAYGLFYGSVADPGDLGAAGLPVALPGAAAGVVWGALVVAAVAPLIGVPVIVASFFVAALTVGPAAPGAVSAGIVSMVAGWMVGIQLRWLLVGRRRPPEVPQLVDRSRPRRPAPISRSERTTLAFSGAAGAGLLVVPALLLVVPTPDVLPAWLVVVALTLLWSVPTGWWSGMVQSRYAVGGAPFAAAQWGILFNAWGSAGVHGMPATLTAGMAGITLGFVARRLYEARVGRFPRQRPGSASAA